MPPLTRPLFFLSDLDGGGAQRAMIDLLRHWPDQHPRPLLAVGRASGAGRLWLDGIDFVDLGAARLRWALLPLRRLIVRERPSVVYSTIAAANVIAAWSLIGLRGPPLLVANETNSHRARGDLSFVQRMAIGHAYRRAATVVAYNEAMRREFMEDYRLEAAHVVTIHNPVDVDDLRERAHGSARPWAGEGPMVVAAGRLVRQKGFDILLRAFAQLRTKDARLAILGEGPDREALMRLAGELGVAERIVMPGHVANIAPWFAHAAAFALSSRWEGFGLVIVEAMACGAPVVAFDCPHGPADVIEDGRTGVLAPALDGDALAAALDRVLGDGDLAARLRAAGRPAAMRFSAPAIARAYAGLFDDLHAAARH